MESIKAAEEELETAKKEAEDRRWHCLRFMGT